MKQQGFNRIHLYNILNLNTINTVSVALSPVGAASITMAGIVALSWTGSLFFSTLENYIPNTLPKLKSIITGVKFTTALPIRWNELLIKCLVSLKL